MKTITEEELKIVADIFVTENEDPEVRRMYGHHYRSFSAGVRWADEKLSKRITLLEEALLPFKKLADSAWADQRERTSDVLYQFNTATITFKDLQKVKELLTKI